MKSPEGHLLGTRRNKTEHSRQPQAHSWLKNRSHEWGVHDKQEISRKHKTKRVRGARRGLVAMPPSTTVRKMCRKCGNEITKKNTCYRSVHRRAGKLYKARSRLYRSKQVRPVILEEKKKEKRPKYPYATKIRLAWFFQYTKSSTTRIT